MPPPLPDRYRLELRLGRDHDVEEWLATDTSLDRPVLIRVLGPETPEPRRGQFLAAVRGAAAVTHPHLAAVFAAGLIADGAYSVSEWGGGVTMAHRIAAGEAMPVDEFLPNAAGLAAALADLHAAGQLHGAIDPGAVLYAYAHPAKLTGFGRPLVDASADGDVRALAATLEASLTGSYRRDLPPSQIVDGVTPQVDRTLAAARNGELTAATLAEALRAAPTAPRPPARRAAWSWRWLVPVALLITLALGIVLLGNLFTGGSASPVLFPATPTATTAPPPTAATTTTAPPAGGPSAIVVQAATYDPLGDGTEHDSGVPLLLDGDLSTAWRTESYFDPLPRLKSGVGLTFEVQGAVTIVELAGISDGTAYSLYWADRLLPALDGWQRVQSGRAAGSQVVVQVPARDGGVWMVWLTDLPRQADDQYQAAIAEVRFRS